MFYEHVIIITCPDINAGLENICQQKSSKAIVGGGDICFQCTTSTCWQSSLLVLPLITVVSHANSHYIAQRGHKMSQVKWERSRTMMKNVTHPRHNFNGNIIERIKQATYRTRRTCTSFFQIKQRNWLTCLSVIMYTQWRCIQSNAHIMCENSLFIDWCLNVWRAWSFVWI